MRGDRPNAPRFALGSVLSALIVSLALFQLSAFAQQEDPGRLFDAGVEAQQHGDFRAAIRDYRAYLAVRPNDFEAKVNLGAALVHEQQYDDAVAAYRSALSQQPQNAGVLLDLGLAYYKKGDLADARQQFAAVIQAQPGNLQAAILLGDSDNRLGHSEEAIQILGPLEKQNSANTDFEYVFGSAQITAGDKSAGVARIEKVAAETNSADAYLLAGSALLEMNDFTRARGDLERAMKLNPKLTGIYSLTGQAFDQTGDLKDAEELFREALQFNPDDFIANLYLGAMLAKRRDLRNARPYLTKAVTLKPDSAMAQYEMGMLESLSGNYEAAVRGLQTAAKEDPKWMEPHVELATLYYRLNQPDAGAKERQIVRQMAAETQKKGPTIPQ